MFSFFRKKKRRPGLKIDFPDYFIDARETDIEGSLNNAGVEYRLVNDGFLTFEGRLFGSSIPLIIGIHFTPRKLKHIELFRTQEYLASPDYDVNVSFSELSDMLKKEFGEGISTASASIGGSLCEQWAAADYVINHYIIDRFEAEEHLNINFYKN